MAVLFVGGSLLARGLHMCAGFLVSKLAPTGNALAAYLRLVAGKPVL
jgi:hypothetical protein